MHFVVVALLLATFVRLQFYRSYHHKYEQQGNVHICAFHCELHHEIYKVKYEQILTFLKLEFLVQYTHMCCFTLQNSFRVERNGTSTVIKEIPERVFEVNSVKFLWNDWNDRILASSSDPVSWLPICSRNSRQEARRFLFFRIDFCVFTLD